MMGKGQIRPDITLLSPYPFSFWDHQAPSLLSSKTPLAQSAGALWEGRRNKREKREQVVSGPRVFGEIASFAVFWISLSDLCRGEGEWGGAKASGSSCLLHPLQWL